MKKTVIFIILAAFAITVQAQNADSIINHCWEIYENGNYIEGIVELEMALNKLDTNSIEYATALMDLGTMNWKKPDFPNYFEAKDYYLKAKDVYEKLIDENYHATFTDPFAAVHKDYGILVDKNHPDYVHLISILGDVCYKVSDFTQAEKYYLEYMDIVKKSKGKNHPDYISLLSKLGVTYYELNDFEQSEKYLLEAKDMQKKVLGTENSDYISTLVNLGNFYKKKKNYSDSENYFIEAKNIRTRLFGKNHEDYIKSLRNLEELYREMRDFAKTDKVSSEIESIRNKRLDDDNSIVEQSKSSSTEGFIISEQKLILAKKLCERKEYQGVIDMLQPALQNDFDENDSISLDASFYLAKAHIEIEDYKDAEILLSKVLEIYKKQKKENDYTLTLGLLATIYYRNLKNYEKAGQFLSESYLSNLFVKSA